MNLVVTEAGFAALDRDHDGLLNPADLSAALEVAGVEVGPEILQAMAQSGSGPGLDLEALRQLLSKDGAAAGEPDLASFVAGLAGVEDGKVGVGGLKGCLQRLGFEADDDVVTELLRGFDRDGDGQLCPEELAALLRPC